MKKLLYVSIFFKNVSLKKAIYENKNKKAAHILTIQICG